MSTTPNTKADPVVWKDFLEKQPPDCKEIATTGFTIGSDLGNRSLSMPTLNLFCPTEKCSAVMDFDNQNQNRYEYMDGSWKLCVLYYHCRHCKETEKTYAVLVKLNEGTDPSGTRRVFYDNGVAIKFGEYPAFGDPVPSRVLDLMSDDRELFLKGRRAEKQGMGIGAFSYYRRVVENQWQNLIDVIISVANAQKADAAVIQELQNAKGEHQFEKAIELTKDKMPKALLIDGVHNPLQLLHSALSKDMHGSTDEECLSLAGDIREMLTRYAGMREEALKDRSTLDQTLTRLLQKRAERKEAPENTVNDQENGSDS